MSWESILKKTETNSSAKLIDMLEREVKQFLNGIRQELLTLNKFLDASAFGGPSVDYDKKVHQQLTENVMEKLEVMQKEINNGDALLGLGAILDITMAIYNMDDEGFIILVGIVHDSKHLVTFEMNNRGIVSQDSYRIDEFNDDDTYAPNKDGSFSWGSRKGDLE